jgi:hypothetical protein
MRAREIEKWLVKVLHDGATELVDAEIAKHIVEMWQRHIEREAGYRRHDIEEAAVTLPILRARALAQEKARASAAPANGSQSSPKSA